MSNRKEDIINLAKELFLTPDEHGNHKYSLRDIALEIQQRFNKNINYSTISLWSKKYGWDKLWEEGIRLGITEALAKQQSEKTKEEQFLEAIASKKQQDFVMVTNLKILAYKFIKENGFSNVKEALQAFDIGMKYSQGIEMNVNVKTDRIKEIDEAIEELERALKVSKENDI